MHESRRRGQGAREASTGGWKLAVFVRSLLIVPAVLIGLPVLDAAAATEPHAARPPAHEAGLADGGAAAPLQLAQAGDVEIYIDEYGRRVVVDAYTGEVLGIERPGTYRDRNQDYRRALRQRQLRRSYQDGNYYDPNADVPYRPRAYRNGLPVEEDPAYSREPMPEAPQYAYPDAPDEVYPEAPRAYPDPRTAERKPIERRPLDATPPGNPARLDTGNQPGDRSASIDPYPSIENRDSTGAIEPAQPEPGPAQPGAAQPSISFGARDEVAALQILLDRKGASPGVIDGRFGSNVDKALVAYRDITGDNLRSIDTAKIKEELAATGGDPFTSYTITPEDAAGPYVASVPEDYGAKAKLDRLSYTSVSEALAERFHMDEAFLKALNPGANFGRPGTVIKVANIGMPVSGQVTRIIADKAKKQVRAFDASGKLLAAYPATIGSSDTPSPSGTHIVSRVAFDPEYTYNPKLNFKQGDNDKVLRIPPGPNGPVGSIWIALDKPTYGIHGTPEPSKIGKTESHGCVRLTNWDAAELAKMVKSGTEVVFLD